MVKLGRGSRRHTGGRLDPVPLFPPGDLPVFGPPPVNMRRPMAPPRGMPRGGGGYAHPPLSRPLPPHMRPPPPPMYPLPPPPFPHRRPPHPPALRPLLQAPVLPPRPLPYMRGGRPMQVGRGGGPGQMKHLGKPMKRNRPKKNKPKDGEHFCETCDRGWDSAEKLAEHMASHITCGIDGCEFTGHPKIVSVHVTLQHDTGLFKKIGSVQSDEDIERWRQERKRNFPTKENRDRKAAEKKEMVDRGEKLGIVQKEQKKNLSAGKQTTGRNLNRNVRLRKKRQFLTVPLLKKYRIASKEELLAIVHKKSEPAPEIVEKSATSESEAEEGQCFSDDEWQEAPSHKEEPKVNSTLSTLITSYGSADSSSEDEHFSAPKKFKQGKQEISINKTESILTNNIEIESSQNTCDLEDAPEELSSKVCDPDPDDHGITSTDSNSKLTSKGPLLETSTNTKPNRNRRKVNDKDEEQHIKKQVPKPARTIPKRRLTLLQKLLQDEIRHERNYILQCVRYVIENNFFDIERVPTKSPSAPDDTPSTEQKDLTS